MGLSAFVHKGDKVDTWRRTILAYEKAEEFNKAEAWQRKLLAFVKDSEGADSPACADELAALGANLLRQKRWGDTESTIRECLAVRVRNAPDSWTTFNTKFALGGALLSQKKYADGEPHLRKGYEGMKKREKTIPPHDYHRLIEAVDHLIDLYTATDKPDEVKKWEAELDRYAKKGNDEEVRE